MTKLFAVGFPRAMDELQLAQLFGPFGDIELLNIVRDKVSSQSKGFGFIHMGTKTAAQNAIADLNGKVFGDRTLEVRFADDAPAPPKPVFKPASNRTPEKPAERKKRPRINR